MQAAGFGAAQQTILPSEIVTAVEDCGFFESIPLWAVTLIGGLFITVLSFIMIMTVYGRFFKLYLYTAIAPIPLSSFAGEPSQNVGKSFIKSYAAVCLEGAIIVLACIIFSLFAASPPTIDPNAAAKATAAGIKAAAKATAAAVKAIIAATKALIAAIAAGGWVAVVIIVIICLIGLIVASCFGIFFSGEDTGTGQTMQTVVREINEDYENQLDTIKANISYDVLEMSGSRAVWPEVLSVYAVKTTTDPDNAMDVATVDDARKAILKDIFWQMNEIFSRTETNTETVIEESDDGNGNIVETTTTVTRTTLYITASHKTAEEMADHFDFNADHREQLSELLAEENNSLWAAVLYGIGVSDDAIVAVALSQVGNIGGQPYWSWYGFEGRVEWCACFVSWCANECGYIENGIIPKFAGCVNGVQWFKDRGQWADNSIEPTPGMIIFFDWDSQNGSSGPRTDSPTIWVSWKNAKTALSIPSREIPVIAAVRGSILWAIMKSLVMVFPPIKQDAVLPGGISLHTKFLRICSFLLCKHPYKFYLKIVSKKLLRDDL